MASYVDQALIQDEKVTYRGELSVWGFFWPIFFGLLLLPVFGLGLLIWLWAWITYRSTELAVTNRRVIFKTGLIRRRTVEMNMDKVETVDVDQTLFGRLLGYGTVHVRGTGSGW